MQGNILVISGPSGSGKSSLMKELLRQIPHSYFSISSTTRDIRNGEVDGVNYHFISKEAFEQDIRDGFFLEWAKVHDNYYGTPLKPMLKELAEGKLIILDIDVQGHKIAREKMGHLITSVFVTTTDQQSLKQRLIHRGTDDSVNIEKRLSNAILEMQRIHEYDYLLINDDLTKAHEQLLCIARVSQLKATLVDSSKLLNKWVLG